MYKLSPGKWYLIFTCEKCNTRQVLFPDLSNGGAKLTGLYDVDCDGCGHRGEYDGEEIERYQYPPTTHEAMHLEARKAAGSQHWRR